MKHTLPPTPVNWSESLGVSLHLLDPHFAQALQSITEPSSAQVVLNLIKSDIHNLRSNAKNVQKLRSNVHNVLLHPILWGLLVQTQHSAQTHHLCDQILNNPLLYPLANPSSTSNQKHIDTLLQTPFRIMTLTGNIYCHLMVGTLFRISSVLRETHQKIRTASSIDTTLASEHLKQAQKLCTLITDQAKDSLQYLHHKSPNASTQTVWHTDFLSRIFTLFPLQSLKDNDDLALTQMHQHHVLDFIQYAQQLGVGLKTQYPPINTPQEHTQALENSITYTLALCKLQQQARFSTESLTAQHTANPDYPFLPNLFVNTFIKTFTEQLLAHGIELPLPVSDVTTILSPLLQDTDGALTDYHISDQIFSQLQLQGILDPKSTSYLIEHQKDFLIDAIFPERSIHFNIYPRNEHWLTFALQAGLNPKYVDGQGNTLLSMLNDRSVTLNSMTYTNHLQPQLKKSHHVCEQMLQKLLDFGTPIEYIRPQKSFEELLATDGMRLIYRQFSEHQTLQRVAQQTVPPSKRPRL